MDYNLVLTREELLYTILAIQDVNENDLASDSTSREKYKALEDKFVNIMLGEK